MNVAISILAGIGISYFGVKEIMIPVKPYGDRLNEMCFHPANNDSIGNLRVVYSGFSYYLDRALCTIVNFFQASLHDILGMPITALLLVAFGTAIVLMSLEGARKGFKKSLLAFFPLFALSANVITATVMFSLIWAPISLYYSRRAQQYDYNITSAQVYGSLMATLIGYGIPTSLMFFVEPDTKFEQDIVALWQFSPLLLIPLVPICIKFFKQPSAINRVDDKTLRERLYVVEGKVAVKRVYLVLGVVNLIHYFGTYLKLTLDGIHIWESLILLYRAPDNLPATVTFDDLSQVLSTRVMLIDFAALSLGFFAWALLDGGLWSGLVFALSMPIIGPSASLSFYSYYRESKCQNLAATNPPTQMSSKSKSRKTKKL